LRSRISFILKEYEKILNINNAIRNLKDKTNEYFMNIIIPQIKDSGLSMKILYDCYSDEMNNLIMKIDSLNNNVAIRIGTDGWRGDLIVMGNNDILSDLNKFFEKEFEFLNSKDNLVNIWHYEFNQFCDFSYIGGGIAILNPEFEDFMFL